jgi:hypothetical protein
VPDRLLVLRKAGCHLDDLHPDDGGRRAHRERKAQDGGQHRQRLAHADASQNAHHGRNQQAENHGERNRYQDVASEVQQRQHCRSGDNAACTLT